MSQKEKEKEKSFGPGWKPNYPGYFSIYFCLALEIYEDFKMFIICLSIYSKVEIASPRSRVQDITIKRRTDITVD